MCNVVRLLCSSIGFCFLLGSAGAFAQDDRFEFKGAKLGISQNEFTEKLDFFKCENPKRQALADVVCTARRGDLKNTCDIRLGMEIFKACDTEHGRKINNIYRFGGLLTNSFYAFFYANALSMVSIRVQSGGFDTVTAALIEKYGKPNAVKTEALQTKIGATYQNITMTWRRSDSSIIATKFSGDINTSLIIYKLNSADNEIKKRSEEERKKNASDL